MVLDPTQAIVIEKDKLGFQITEYKEALHEVILTRDRYANGYDYRFILGALVFIYQKLLQVEITEDEEFVRLFKMCEDLFGDELFKQDDHMDES